MTDIGVSARESCLIIICVFQILILSIYKKYAISVSSVSLTSQIIKLNIE